MLVGLTLVIVVGMLYFGVRLKGYRPLNSVEWPAGEGLYFKRSAIAYTEDFFSAALESDARKAGLTIEMLLRVEELGNASFCFILSVHAGSDKQQLLIGQWRRWLMVMNGDDYDARQGVSKIYMDLGAARKGPIWLAIVADGRGTSVYLDGRLAKVNANLHLYYPSSPGGRPRLVLGNSVYGKHGWCGAIQGLALYARPLERSLLQAHYDQWAAQGVFSLDRSAAPEIFYGFDAPVDGRVINRAADAYHLEVPALMRVLEREYLQWPWVGSDPRWHLAGDMVLNLAGFVPLGFMLVVLLGRRGSARLGWVAAVGAACLFSLAMELAQAWIPSRDSSMLDWGLNTLGAGLGGWLGLPAARG